MFSKVQVHTKRDASVAFAGTACIPREGQRHGDPALPKDDPSHMYLSGLMRYIFGEGGVEKPIKEAAAARCAGASAAPEGRGQRSLPGQVQYLGGLGGKTKFPPWWPLSQTWALHIKHNVYAYKNADTTQAKEASEACQDTQAKQECKHRGKHL